MNGELNFSLLEEQTFLYLITASRPFLESHSLLFSGYLGVFSKED